MNALGKFVNFKAPLNDENPQPAKAF